MIVRVFRCRSFAVHELSEDELRDAAPEVEQGTPVPRVAGRLRARLAFWKTFAVSSIVLSWIAVGFPLRFEGGIPPPPVHLRNHASSLTHTDFVTGAVRECLAMGAVRVARTKPRCVLPLMVDASRDKLRLIFNGKYLNSYLDFPKFKYEKLQTFVDVLRPGDGLYYWDYKSGYYHVDLHETAREYVAFEWGGTWYEFCVLPFGLAPACWVFTKINRELVGKWRKEGKRIHPYVDDFCGAIPAVHLEDPSALAELREVITDVVSCGWLVSEEKSQLYLTRRLVHIGVGIDLLARELFVPDKAVKKIRDCAGKILSAARRVPLKLVAKFAGLVNAQWFVLGGVCRMFARAAAVLIADTLREGSWGSHVKVTPMFEAELHFWESDDFRTFQRGIWLPREAGLRLEVQHSDASDFGWGAMLEPAHGYPTWLGRSYLSLSDRLQSSTHREMRGVLDALKAFNSQGRLRRKRILVVCDNQGVHFILESGSRHPQLQQLALEIVRFCVVNEAVLSSQWVPREFETITDDLSKVRDYDDWMVHPVIFRGLDCWIAGFGRRHTADRFATDKNHLVDRFYSAWWCPGTSGVDSLRQPDWRRYVNWCNPPFRLIGELLLFLEAERAAATIVVPMWTTQPWWLLLCPDGVHFADCVVQWTELETSRST